MGSWVQSFVGARPFLGAGGGGFGGLASGGRLIDQPRPNRNGELHMEICCAGDCNTPRPAGEGQGGIDDEFLCNGWLAFLHVTVMNPPSGTPSPSL